VLLSRRGSTSIAASTGALSWISREAAASPHRVASMVDVATRNPLYVTPSLVAHELVDPPLALEKLYISKSRRSLSICNQECLSRL
jgi:hypothetical protein